MINARSKKNIMPKINIAMLVIKKPIPISIKNLNQICIIYSYCPL
jgi:hypothetical protein